MPKYMKTDAILKVVKKIPDLPCYCVTLEITNPYLY